METEQISEEILATLANGPGFHYRVIFDKVLGVHFRCSPENTHKLQQTLQTLVKSGRVMHTDGWYALRKGEKPQEAKITAFSRESIAR